jgi:hypothetical protein
MIARLALAFFGGVPVEKYTRLKLQVNSVGNFLMVGLAWSNCDDFTNKCKTYRRMVVQQVLHIRWRQSV